MALAWHYTFGKTPPITNEINHLTHSCSTQVSKMGLAWCGHGGYWRTWGPARATRHRLATDQRRRGRAVGSCGRAVQPSCKGDGAPLTFRPIRPLHELNRELGQNLGPGSAE